jgi:hypothetical protein
MPGFVKSQKRTKKTRMKKRTTTKTMEKKEKAIRNDAPPCFGAFCVKQESGSCSGITVTVLSSPKNIYAAWPQADFFVGGQNSITLPRCCGGSHFTCFENRVGM